MNDVSRLDRAYIFIKEFAPEIIEVLGCKSCNVVRRYLGFHPKHKVVMMFVIMEDSEGNHQQLVYDDCLFDPESNGEDLVLHTSDLVDNGRSNMDIIQSDDAINAMRDRLKKIGLY